MPQIIDNESGPEWRRDVNVAAYFYLPLPDVLPLEDGYTFAFRHVPPGAFGRFLASLETRRGRRLSGPLDVSLRFMRIPSESPHTGLRAVLFGAARGWPADWGVHEDSLTELSNASEPATSVRMVVEAVVPLDAADNVLLGDPSTDAFAAAREDALERAFVALQRFQAAVALATGQLVRPLTRWTCPSPLILHGIRRKDGAGETVQRLTALVLEDQYLGQMLAHQRESSPVSAEQWPYAHWILAAQDREEPVVRMLELREAAVRLALVDGDVVSAVAMLHSANDLLIGQTMRCLLWEDGMAPADAGEFLSRTHAAALVKTHLPQRLKGRWSLDQPGPVKDWYEHCHLLRQRVLHGGEVPSTEAMDTALEASWAFEKHLAERLLASAANYPRTCVLMASWTISLETPQLQQAQESRSDWYVRYKRWLFRLTGGQPGAHGEALLWIQCRPLGEPRGFVHRSSTFGVSTVDSSNFPAWIVAAMAETRTMANATKQIQRRLVVVPDPEFPQVDAWQPDWEFDSELFTSDPRDDAPDVQFSFALPPEER